MREYTYQIGEGAGDKLATRLHSEPILADSLGEAIGKARAITKHRRPHAKETVVRLVQSEADQFPLWASSVEEVRNA